MGRPDFPRSIIEFQDRFATDAACLEYLADCRWPEGFVCPGCGGRSAWMIERRHLWQVLPNSRATTLEAFTKATTAKGAIVHTDGLFSYNGLPKLGYQHRPRKVASVPEDEQLLPRVHRAISNLKAWIHGTHRRVSPEHLPVYLDEYVFRHNRRGTPIAAFQTLLGLGAQHDPTTYQQITHRDAAA